MHDPVAFSDNNYSSIIQAEEFLSKYKPLFKWTDSEEILEVGCSNGLLTKKVLYPFVQANLRRLIAADIYKPAIKIANATNDIANLSFQVMDITDEEESDKYVEKFHHVFGFYLFHIVHKPDLCSKNIFKMLKPNGQLFTSIALSANLVTWAMEAQRQDKSKPWSKYIQDLRHLFYNFGSKPLEAIRKLFTDVGFVMDVLDLQTLTFVFDGMQQLKNTMMSANVFLRHVPEELQAQYIDDYLDKILQYVTCEQDGKYSYPMDVVTIVATKMSHD